MDVAAASAAFLDDIIEAGIELRRLIADLVFFSAVGAFVDVLDVRDCRGVGGCGGGGDFGTRLGKRSGIYVGESLELATGERHVGTYSSSFPPLLPLTKDLLRIVDDDVVDDFFILSTGDEGLFCTDGVCSSDDDESDSLVLMPGILMDELLRWKSLLKSGIPLLTADVDDEDIMTARCPMEN